MLSSPSEGRNRWLVILLATQLVASCASPATSVPTDIALPTSPPITQIVPTNTPSPPPPTPTPVEPKTIISPENITYLEELGKLGGGDGTILGVAFSPDGKILATASNDGTAKIWDIGKRSLVITLPHDMIVTSVAISPDGKLLATADTTNRIRLWEIANGKRIKTLAAGNPNFGSTRNDPTFSLDGKFLAASVIFKTYVWDAKSINVLQILPPAGSGMGDRGRGRVAFSPNGELLAVAEQDGTVRLWNTSDWKQVRALKLSTMGFVDDVAFSPDGQMLAATDSENQTLQLWEVSGWRESLTLAVGFSAPVTFSPDSQLLASRSKEGFLTVWEVSNDQALYTYDSYITEAFAFSPDGKWLAIAHNNLISLLGVP